MSPRPPYAPSSAIPSTVDGAEGVAIWGRSLRYLLVVHLFARGPSSVRELVELVGADGFAVAGRPSKEISDALRWEVQRGRVVRLGRGRYGPGALPSSTGRRIRAQVRSLRAEASAERRAASW